MNMNKGMKILITKKSNIENRKWRDIDKVLRKLNKLFE